MAGRLVLVSVALALVATSWSVPVAHAAAPVTPGGPDGSPQQYRFVDSTYRGCNAPSGPVSVNVGCPSQWESAGNVHLYTCCANYLEDTLSYYYYNQPGFVFPFYGQNQNYLQVSSNGFMIFQPALCPYVYGEGAPTARHAQPRSLPYTPANAGCGSGTFEVSKMVAGMWLNMYVGRTDYNTGTAQLCPGDPVNQGIYFSPLRGTSPNRYRVIEYRNVRVSDPSRPNNNVNVLAAYCQQPHTIANFEMKVFENGAFDVLIQNVDTRGQGYSLGMMNDPGTYGLNYASGAAGSSARIFTDLGIRYYPVRGAQADSFSTPVRNEKSGSVTDVLRGRDPDWQDADASLYGPAPASGRGDGLQKYTAADIDTSLMAHPTWLTWSDDRTFTFTPDSHWNGIEKFRYRSHSMDGSYSPWATVTIKYLPVNDAPVAVDNIFYGDPESGVYEDVPGILRGATDWEVDHNETPLQKLKAVGVSLPTLGSLNLSQDGSFSYDPAPGMQVGDQVAFRYKVCDNGVPALCSPAANATIKLQPENPRLIARADRDYSLREDDGMAPRAADGVMANDFIDPSTVNARAVLVRGPAHAAPSGFALDADGSFIYRPAPNWNGLDSFQYRLVSDDGGGSQGNKATVLLPVRPVNDAPVFLSQYGDEWDLIEDAAAVRLNNFVDLVTAGPNAPDENAQMAACRAVAPSPCFHFDVNPPDFFTDPPYYSGAPIGKAPSITFDALPNLSGDLKFRTGRDRSGPADITVWFTDGGGTSDGGIDTYPSAAAPYRFHLNVAPQDDRPVAVPEEFTVLRNHAIERDASHGLMSNDFDPDGKAMDLQVQTATAYCGSFVGRPDGSFTYRADKPLAGTAPCVDTVTYVLRHDEPGTAEFSIPVTDTITVLYNGPPVAEFKASTLTARVGEGVSFTQAAYDTDPVDAIPAPGITAYSWDFADGATSSLPNPVHAFGRPGLYPVRLTVTDTQNDTATKERVIRIEFAGDAQGEALADQYGDAPIAYAGRNVVVTEGEPFVLHGSATPAETAGRPYSYAWMPGGPLPVQSDDWQAANLSALAPDLHQPEPVILSFDLTVSDGVHASAPSRVLVTVLSSNRAPVAVATAPSRVPAGETVRLDLAASDPDGDALRVTWIQEGGPAGSLIGGNTSALYTPAPGSSGVARFVAEVTDGELTTRAPVEVLVVGATAVQQGFVQRLVGVNRVSLESLGTGSCRWEFDDGSAASTCVTVHEFAPGTHQVRLVLNANGVESVQEGTVRVPGGQGQAAPALAATSPAPVAAIATAVVLVLVAAALVAFLLRRAAHKP